MLSPEDCKRLYELEEILKTNKTSSKTDEKRKLNIKKRVNKYMGRKKQSSSEEEDTS